MAQTNINIRMDSELKKEFEEFCSEMGLTMTTAFTVFAKKVVSEHRITFEIGVSRLNLQTIKALEEVEILKNDPSLGKTYDNVDEMMKDILD